MVPGSKSCSLLPPYPTPVQTQPLGHLDGPLVHSDPVSGGLRPISLWGSDGASGRLLGPCRAGSVLAKFVVTGRPPDAQPTPNPPRAGTFLWGLWPRGWLQGNGLLPHYVVCPVGSLLWGVPEDWGVSSFQMDSLRYSNGCPLPAPGFYTPRGPLLGSSRKECTSTGCTWTARPGTDATGSSRSPRPRCSSCSCPCCTSSPSTPRHPRTPSCTCAPSTRSPSAPTSPSSPWCTCGPCCPQITGSSGEWPSCVTSSKFIPTR